MTELFLEPEQDNNRLQEMRAKVAKSKKHPRTLHAVMQATPAPEEPLIISAEPLVTSVSLTVPETAETVPETPETASVEVPVKTRRKRRSKWEMMEARGEVVPDTLSSRNEAIAYDISPEDVFRADSVYTVEQEEAQLARYNPAPDELLPESIAYLVNKVRNGKQLCKEDREALEAVVRKYRVGLLPFVYLHIATCKEFASLIRSAKASLALNTAEGGEDAWFDLNSVVLLMQQYPFLGTEANILLLNSTMLEAPAYPRRLAIWRSRMRTQHGFDFRKLTAP